MKILYLPCHSVHEYDEVRLLHEIGHEPFSPGAYFNPQCDEFLRPGIPGLTYDPEIVNQYHELGGRFPGEDAKDHLTRDFVDNFDCVMVMSLRRWVECNWDAIKHKPVILRTNGQSDANYEKFVYKYRSENSNFKAVRYSPKEDQFPFYGGSDAVIRFGKKIDEFPEWEGNLKELATLVQHMKGRGDACNWNTFYELSNKIQCKLYGMSNEDAGDLWFGRKTEFNETFELLKQHRCYFYAGTKPANYTLNFIEMLCIGMPIIAVGALLGNDHNLNTYEIPDLIEHGVNGFISNDISEIESIAKELFNNDDLAKNISIESKKLAYKYFDEKNVKKQWHDFLKSL